MEKLTASHSSLELPGLVIPSALQMMNWSAPPETNGTWAQGNMDNPEIKCTAILI